MSLSTALKSNGKQSYLRWTSQERWQHWLLAVSFIGLAITGFALKYPDSWWVRPVIGISWFEEMRGTLHRVFGAVFLLLGIYHVGYLMTRRGRKLFVSFLPGKKDARDLVQNLSYFFGFRKTGPTFGHFNYMEKAEYLALIWGGVIMIVTGLMLWFKDITLMFFPRWIIDLMTVIHLYEAWLASLAIVVWHFYGVIFDPEVYPINASMINGALSDEEQREHHYDEWLELQGEEDQESGPETTS